MQDARFVNDMTLFYNNSLDMNGQSFVWGNSLISAKGDDEIYYLQDHLNSPVRLFGKNQEAALGFDEFGMPLAESGINQPFGFTGYQVDGNGLQYAQARYYAPDLGRFSAEDPIRDKFNWYGYCDGNPINFVDPSGLFPLTEALLNAILGVSSQNLARAAANSIIARQESIAYAIDNGFYREIRDFAGGGLIVVRDPITWDNEVDAFRHFNWNARNARQMSVSDAIIISNVHEIANLRNHWITRTPDATSPLFIGEINSDNLMDLWNNWIGIMLGSDDNLAHKSINQLFEYAMNRDMLILSGQDVSSRLGISDDYRSMPYWTVLVMWNVLGYNMTIVGRDSLMENINLNFRNMNCD